MDQDTIVWLAVIILFLIAEAATTGLYTIWFAIGGLVALILSLFDVHIGIQIGAFLVVSALCLTFIYPMVKNKLKFAKVRTNAQALIQKNGIVIEAIDNLAPSGQVRVDGQIWTARSIDGSKIEKGKKVVIDSIQGVKLIVKEAE